jgi:PAS domain S-box-containing protein
MTKKILVVDDHEWMLEFMAGLLRQDGHDVVTAQDGLSALDKLTSFIPDIIFVDLIMPKIGGDKLCRIVRRMPDLSHCYVVLVSATAADEDVDLKEIGANACIVKGPSERMTGHILAVLEEAKSNHRVEEPKLPKGFDTTQSRRITKELISRSRHLETILESMAQGILEVFSGRIVYANSAAVSLFGIPEEKLLGSYPSDLFDEAMRPQVERLLKSGTDKPSEIAHNVPVEHNRRQITIKNLPVKGGVSSSIILMTDVTEQKRIEAQLSHIHKMETIGTLAGGIAHDFNNLLTGIQGNASLMLLETEPSHPYYDRLKSIEKQVQSGARLTSHLLGYARKGRYEVKPLDLNRFVEEISDTFGRTKKQITIHRELAENLFSIEADQAQIEQVLVNLFVNAADAMAVDGHLMLQTVNITHGEMKGKIYDPKPGNYVLLTVTDTGMGMDKKTQERIFDPFFTTKEMGRGIGLGLASVYGIVKGHGGYIDVESKRGRGTTFNVYFPATEKRIEKKVGTAEAFVSGTGTVLLVDDEDVIRKVGEDLLKAMGYQVLIAKDGKEAVEIYEKKLDEIDVVLLDMVMPNMDGGKAYDRMKEINSNVKVLLSSGFSIDGEATEILERGCNGFIQKPFTLEKLSRKIREIAEMP